MICRRRRQGGRQWSHWLRGFTNIDGREIQRSYRLVLDHCARPAFVDTATTAARVILPLPPPPHLGQSPSLTKYSHMNQSFNCQRALTSTLVTCFLALHAVAADTPTPVQTNAQQITRLDGSTISSAQIDATAASAMRAYKLPGLAL